MSKRRKNRTATAVLLVSVILAVTLAAGGAAVYFSGSTEGFPAFASSSEKSESSKASEPEEASSVPEEASEPEEPEKPELPPVSQPEELCAAILRPGTDYMAGELTETVVRTELDQIFDSVSALGLNSVIAEVRFGEKTICNVEGMPSVMEGFDVLDYIANKSKEKGLYLYTTFPVLATAEGGIFAPVTRVDNALLDEISARAAVFATKYRPSGVLLEDYTLPGGGAGMAAYQQNGLGMGYESYLREMTKIAFTTAAKAIRKASPGTEAGLYTGPVWANKNTNENGSETTGSYQVLLDGNADSRAWVQDGLVDFVAVQSYFATDDSSLKFSSVTNWWGELAKAAEVPLYAVHDAAKASGTWTADELAQQYLEAKNAPAFSGSAFSTISALAANPKGSTDNLKRAINKEIDLSYILEKLELTKPSQKRVEVTEPQFTLTGASDPDYDLTMNGEKVERNAKGYFNITVDLQEGENAFRFQHKEQDMTYTIVRKSEILREITPIGQSPITGGMSVNITAMAYPGATVYATLGGQKIAMAPTEETGDEGDANGSSYIKYVGSYKTSVVASEHSLGKITVTATYHGTTASKDGAVVTLLPKVELGQGQLVQVIAKSAETFPDTTLDDTSVNTYFPLCAGAMDYTVSDELEYSDGTKSFTYYILNSGRRVYAKDIDVVQDRSLDLNGNQVTGMKISSSGSTTSVVFQTKKQVSYTLRYNKNGSITIEFHYTDKVSAGNKVGENPLFASASWNGSTVTLQLTNPSAFIGYTAEYSGGDLVFKFKNSPGGLSGARIYIDVGHSSDSPGADGNLGHWTEHDINLAISQQLKEILESNGATVRMLDTASYVTLENRVAKASAFNPHVFVSIHANSFTNSESSGSEAYYFNQFSNSLASRVSTNMANSLGISNRGGKKGLYYVTRTQEFPAILAESGFITNFSDYEMLINSDYQYEIAQGIAFALNSYLASTVGSYASSGGDSSDEEDSTESVDSSSESSEKSSQESSSKDENAVDGITLDQSKLELYVGDNASLSYAISPDWVEDPGVKWSTSNSKVVTVEDGLLTAVSPGKATITIKTKDGAFKDTCRVTVLE